MKEKKILEALFFLVSKDSGKLLYALSILKWLFIINEIYSLCDCTCTFRIVHSIINTIID